MLKQKSSVITKTYYTYDDIPLKVYIDIANSQDLSKLIITGSIGIEELTSIWEEIIRRNSRATEDFTYMNYFEAGQKHALYIAQYNVVKACLILLSIQYDKVVADYLTFLDYKIDTTNSETYAASLVVAHSKSDNLVTKILSKQKELDSYKAKGGEATSISDVIAQLVVRGIKVDENITLALYNSITRLIKKANGRNSDK